MHRSRNTILILSVLVLTTIAVGWQLSLASTPAALAGAPRKAPAEEGVFTFPTPQPTPQTDHTFRPLVAIPFPPVQRDFNMLREAKDVLAWKMSLDPDRGLLPADRASPVPADESTDPPLTDVSEGLINIVLLGTDKRPEWGAWRTDTIIVVSINPEAESVGMLSIPRDLWIEIPDVGVGRINTVDFIGERQNIEGGGPGLLKRTIESNLGLPIHRYARIDLEGFIEVVDALGGVTIEIACPVQDAFLDEPLTGEEGFTELNLDVGVHHLDGLTALRYARSRRLGTDFDRAERQQNLLRSLAEQNLNWEVIPKLPRLWETLSDTVETDLTLPELVKLASIGMQVQQNRIESRFIDWETTENFVTANGAMVLLPNHEALPKAIEEFINPPEEDGRLERENARIEILNGTGTEGIVQIAATRLERRGLNVVRTDTTSQFRQSIVVVDHDKPYTLKVLQKVLELGPESVLRSPEPSDEVDIRVILGSDWHPCR